MFSVSHMRKRKLRCETVCSGFYTQEHAADSGSKPGLAASEPAMFSCLCDGRDKLASVEHAPKPARGKLLSSATRTEL